MCNKDVRFTSLSFFFIIMIHISSISISRSPLTTGDNRNDESNPLIFSAGKVYFHNLSHILSAIRQLMPSEKRQNKICSIKHQEEEVTEPMIMANIFNTYCTGVGQNLAQKITKDSNYIQPTINEPVNSLNLPQVTPAHIMQHITELPNNKSSGVKDLPTKAIKAAKNIISRGLSNIIDNIFDQGKIPQK